MVRTLIIEDEVDAQSLLSNILIEYCPSIQLIGVAGSIDAGITLIESTKPDLVFLDIEIEGGTSFQLLDKLTFTSFQTILTTAYDQYALKAFKYGAIDYILKPYSPKDIIKSIERVNETYFDTAIFNKLEDLIKQNNPTDKCKITISNSQGIHIISIDKIVRLEAHRSYCHIYISDGDKILTSKPLKDLEQQLPNHLFFRTHATHLINMDFISKYIKEDGGVIELQNGNKVPLARRRKQKFLARLTDPRI